MSSPVVTDRRTMALFVTADTTSRTGNYTTRWEATGVSFANTAMGASINGQAGIAMLELAMKRRRILAGLAFYGAVSVLIFAILFDLLRFALPTALAERVALQSEGLVAALVIAVWIQFVRGRLLNTAKHWPLVLLVSCVLGLSGLLLITSDLPSQYKTLNETMFALALLLPYLQLNRPLLRRIPLALSGGLLAIIVLFNRTELVTSLAETLAMLVLAPVAFDMIERGILDVNQPPPSPFRRYSWWAFLALLPVMASLLYQTRMLEGILSEAITYQVRTHEAFVATLLVSVYFVASRPIPTLRSEARLSR